MSISSIRGGRDTISAASGNVANAAATATLAAMAGQINFVTGFSITGAGATAGSVATVTVTGVKGGSLTYIMACPVGALVGVVPLVIAFPTPLEATGSNMAIAVSAGAFGLGNTNAAAVVHGFRVPEIGE